MRETELTAAGQGRRLGAMVLSAVERYLWLGLRLGRHVEGIVDAYYGPPELAAAVEAEPLVDPRALVSDAELLLDELEDGWLRDQVVGLRTYAGVLAGESRSYSDEVEGCYGVRPAHTDEAVFAAAHERLAELLPGQEPLAERYERWRDSIRVPPEQVERTVAAVIEEARTWTRGLVELPDDDGVVLEVVRDKPWLAFSEYLGGLRSRVAVNVDLSMSAVELLHLTSHETYPGHHAERCAKDHLLVRGRGLLEETLVLVPTPQSLVSEGIAELAPTVLLEGDGGGGVCGGPAGCGHRARSRSRSRRRAGPGAVPVGRGQRGVAAVRGRSERGRGARIPRAVGSDDPGARGPFGPLPRRADLADLRDELSGGARALPLVRGGRLAAFPPPADRAGARPRAARGRGRASTDVIRPMSVAARPPCGPGRANSERDSGASARYRNAR
jgi:hypothetical protein